MFTTITEMNKTIDSFQESINSLKKLNLPYLEDLVFEMSVTLEVMKRDQVNLIKQFDKIFI
jgi:vacuolar-type H+-ATPase subunit D/Vma8